MRFCLSGKYTFAISSDDSSELWLSSDENPSKVKLIAWVGNRTLLSGTFKTKIAQFTKYKTQLSRPVFLHKGQKYFIEALHKQANLQDHILVGWKIPGMNNFRHLTGSAVSAVIDDTKAPRDVTKYANFIPQDLPSHSHYRTSLKLDQNVYKFGSDDLRDKGHQAKFVDERDIENMFSSCPYNPSYLVDFKLRRYEGVWLIHDTARYPDDYSDLTHMKQYDQCARRRIKDSHGNQVSSLPPKRRSNQSLYENGSIAVFRNSKAFLQLSFAKSAEEKERAEEQLLETQMDLRDIKRLSQEAEDAAQSSRETSPTVAVQSSPIDDQENVFEMKKKAKRKDVVSAERAKRSISRKGESQERNRNDKGEVESPKKKPQKRSRVETGNKNEKSRGREARAPRRTRDQTSRDSSMHQSNVSSKGTQRKLLSYNTNNVETIRSAGVPTLAASNNKHRIANTLPHVASPMSRRNVNPERYRGFFPIGYNLAELYPQRGLNSSYKNFQQRTRGRIMFYPVDKEDDQRTRMNAAREFVRKMIYAVQLYNHRVNSRSLADAVYRKFGVKMKIPNIVRIPEYNGWIFHQNTSKCASDGNLLLNADVSTAAQLRHSKGPFPQAIFVAATQCNFCRAVVATSKSHV